MAGMRLKSLPKWQYSPAFWAEVGAGRLVVRALISPVAPPSKPKAEQQELDALNALDSGVDRAALNEAVRAALADEPYRVVARVTMRISVRHLIS